MLALEAFSKFQRSFAILSDKEKKTDSPPPLLKSTVAVLLTFMSCIRQVRTVEFPLLHAFA